MISDVILVLIMFTPNPFDWQGVVTINVDFSLLVAYSLSMSNFLRIIDLLCYVSFAKLGFFIILPEEKYS